MIVCIAEKPSVARDIAKILGANHQKQGYLEGAGYKVTWTFGHLCTLKEPQDYDPLMKYWKLENLPIIPPNFGVKVIDNPGIKKQFDIIKDLIHEPGVEYIVNCGDAGQEGELIQRWVLHLAKCPVPVKRLWISSLTEDAIKAGFDQLKEAKEYDNLYAAGSARAIGDWLLGINATRLFTKKFADQGTMLSIGRVQTPTLAMIVERQKEIDAFKSEIYWELKTIYRNVEFTAQIDRLNSEERAQKGIEYLLLHLLEIVNFEIKEGKEKPPKLFDLTSLQVEANKKYGYSADHTLKLTQGLYEKKLITYPRVDTQYLPDDMYEKIPDVLEKMHHYTALTSPLLSQPLPKSKQVFDNSKVTDHHAIIPTNVPIGSLSTEEYHIYDLIARRLIAVFYPDAIISNTVVEALVGTIPFKASGKQILDMGWKVIYQNDKIIDEQDKEEKIQIIPHFDIGEKGEHTPKIHKGKTSPPKYFTEATILRAMETAGKQVEDEELREHLKLNGIGRPSTRANIIETLFKRQYITKKKKNIIATQTGIDLISVINNPLLKSVELTGEWERKLRLIEKNEYDINTFKKELTEMVRQITFEVKHQSENINIGKKDTPTPPKEPKEKKALKPITEYTCPKCERALLIKGKAAYGCGNYTQCNFKIPFELHSKKLTDRQITELITKRKTPKMAGFIIESLTVSGVLSLDSDYALTFTQS